ncbi:MAG: hypothetical protein NDI94_05450 [Candidatus Woesearchaeota archaeon]|nr:hypothetical protein [Candidatus Woesearchaeota archaeon]
MDPAYDRERSLYLRIIREYAEEGIIPGLVRDKLYTEIQDNTDYIFGWFMKTGSPRAHDLLMTWLGLEERVDEFLGDLSGYRMLYNSMNNPRYMPSNN